MREGRLHRNYSMIVRWVSRLKGQGAGTCKGTITTQSAFVYHESDGDTQVLLDGVACCEVRSNHVQIEVLSRFSASRNGVTESAEDLASIKHASSASLQKT
jgi:hypothetical protein